VGTVSSRLARGRALLAKQLTRHGVTLSGATLAAILTRHATAAAVPSKLVLNTVQSACASAAGGAAAEIVSLHVGTLTHGVLKSMFWAKVKHVALSLFAMGVLGVGAVGALSQAGAPQAKLAQLDNSSPHAKEDPNDDASDEIDKLARQPRKGPRLDLHGDVLPPDAITRFGTTRFAAHEGRYLGYSGDGAHIVVANGSEVIVYEAATGRQVRRIRPSAESMALDRDGKLIALGVPSPHKVGLKSIQIVEPVTGKIVRECTDALPQKSTSFRLSPDGTMLAVYLPQTRTICLWNLVTGQELRRWTLGGVTECFEFAPDSKTLFAGDGWKIHVWNVATGAETQLINHRTMVHKLSLAPDGKTLASQSESVQTDLVLWDVATGKKLCEIEAFVSADKATHPRWMFDNPQIFQFEFSPDGKTLVTIRADGLLNVWDAATGKRLKRWDTSALERYPHAAGRFALAPSSQTAALLGPGDFVRFLDLTTGQEKLEHVGHRYGVRSLALSPSGHTLASTSSGPDSTIRVWNGMTGQEGCRVSPGDASEFALFRHGDEGTLTTVRDSYEVKEFSTKLQVWNVGSGKKLREITAPFDIEGQAWRLHAGSPSGRLIATVTQKDEAKIILWDAGTGKGIREFMRAGSEVCALGFSPDSRHVYSGNLERSSGQLERRALVWDVATGKLVREFNVDPAGRFPASQENDLDALFSFNGKWFICRGAARELLAYNMATGRQVRPIAIAANKLVVAFSPDQRTLAVGTKDTTIELFELATGNLRHRFSGGHEGGISALAFSSDGRRLVSGSEDTTALVWDLTGRLADKREPLSPPELEGCWDDLKSDDAVHAYQAIRRLTVASAQAVALLDKHLQPAPPPDRELQRRLITDLASDVFGTRQAATKALTNLGEMSEPALREALDKAPTAEARLRIQQLLAKVEQVGASGEPLRQARAVETLERIGTGAARQVLEKLAAGHPVAHLTKDARAALQRSKLAGVSAGSH
jgi:WD40 repeat protein